MVEDLLDPNVLPVGYGSRARDNRSLCKFVISDH